MKNIFTVLLLAIALSGAAADEPKKPADFAGPATMCNGTYALCIKAPCEKKPDANNLYPCGCIIQTGWNMGPNSCDDRRKNLTSTYSNLFNLGSSTVSCPTSTQWAWCYGAKCEVDPRDPTRAVCKCPTSTTKPTVILVADAMCSDPSKACGMLWSGATPGDSKFANEYYYWWMTTNGQQSNLPATTCPVPSN